MTRKEFLVFWGLIAVSAIPVIDIMKRVLESHAQSPYIETAASSGGLTSGATIVQDSGAIGGKAVKFGNVGFNKVQNATGTATSSGTYPWSVSKQYASNVTTGNMLMAITSRVSSSGGSVSVGQVSDNQGNRWRQVVEFARSDYGVDIWICESCVSTSTPPTVTATQLGFPDMVVMSGLNIQLMEWSGCTGYELTDQIGQVAISTTSVTATTNYNLKANNELVISAIVGNMTAATIPSGWNSALGVTSGNANNNCFIAYNLNSGSSSGSTYSAAWSGLTGGSSGACVIATFVQKGVSSTSPHLVQSCYTDAALGGTLTLTKTSQPFPVNPMPGSLLIAAAAGADYTGGIQSFPPTNVTDTAGNVWSSAGTGGVDQVSGVDPTWWYCDSAKGGSTILTATYPELSEASAFWLAEIANLPPNLTLDSYGSADEASPTTASTTAAISAGDIAFAWRSYVYLGATYTTAAASGWTMVMSDTAGAGNVMMQLSTSSGILTATFNGGGGAADILVTALKTQM